MKILNILRRYGAPVIVSLLSAAFIADAQIVNPSQPATGVPLAGTGISVAGQTVSVNYGVANSPFTGNMTVGGTLGVTGATTLGVTSATTLSASSTVSGAGFTSFMASPPAIGSTVASTGAFTTLANSGTHTATGATVLNGAVSGTGIATYEANINHTQTVLNVAALRTTNCVSGLVYATQGYTTLSDGGNASYVCNGADTTTPDNGGSIIAAANTFRFYLQGSGSVNVRQFGAPGNDTADDQPAFVAAQTYLLAQGGGEIVVPKPPVKYRFNSTFTLLPGAMLHGTGNTFRWRGTVLPVFVDCRTTGSCITVAPAASTITDGVQIWGIQFDGTNATAGSDGLYLNASAASSSIEGAFIQDSVFTNFPNYQIHHTGNVFDAVYKRVSAMNPARTSSDTFHIDGTLPSQITLDDCWLSPYTAGTWAFNAGGVVDARFIGGTVAPYDNTTGANGINVYGGLSVFGTHIENRSSTQTANIGIQYAGDNGASIFPSDLVTFGTGIVIGIAGTPAISASGWEIGGTIVGNNTGAGGHDVVILAGGLRRGVILPIGNLPAPVIQNLRLSTDGVTNEVTDLHTGGFVSAFVQTPDGSIAAPSHSFGNSPTTGLYNAGGGLGLTVGGQSKTVVSSTNFSTTIPIYPAQDTGAIQTTACLYAGSGVPNNANGANGCFYLRGDTPGTVNQRLYIKNAGAWAGIL